ncbi:signal peptidase II [Cellulophaga sp. HaHaR_3_176]|uniref:signal peptidase II n=1 Tax=Cellulophaga sp. HaHaR_3_176 TaxID=1942464 RepID=UPI001C1FDACF|nr:signal peptidase II [Cellulophaga sp. HaHaR_3_176]QWX85487.1 signal peptidase II [Cellulophaga sp. HaHaR_3_176]
MKKFAILILVFFNVGCDQVSKKLVQNQVEKNDYIQLIKDNFILTHVENKGAMLGFGESFPPFVKIILLQVLPVIVLLLLLINILRKDNLNRWLVIAFAFVIGGGIGNLIDRILHGKVTDFFIIKLGFLKTGIFNMADVSVTTGVILILLLSIKNKKLEF